MAGQGRAAARAVGDDLEALVEQAAVKNLLESPPFGFNIGVVVGDVRIVHVRPEADGVRKVLPHLLVFPDALLALFQKRLDAVLFDLLLAADAELLFHLDLHGQAVRVPARLARDIVPLHRAVTRNEVLDDAGDHMPDVRLAVGGRRTVVKGKDGRVGAQGKALAEHVVILPELKHFLFPVDRAFVYVYFFIHVFLPPCFKNIKNPRPARIRDEEPRKPPNTAYQHMRFL